MKKGFIGIFLLMCILITTGCSSEEGFYPLLSVEGDVDNVLSFSYIDNDFTIQKYEYEDKTYSGFKLSDILAAAQVKDQNSKIYLVSSDGMMAAIDYSSLAENYLTFTDKGWEAMNIDYPPSGDVKEIKKIVVVDQNEKPQYGLEVTNSNGETSVLTCGKLLTGNHQIIRKEEGTNKKNDKQVTVITSLEGVYIPDYMNTAVDSFVEVGDSQNKSAYYYGDAYLVSDGNVIDYVSLTYKETIDDIRSISLKQDN